LALFPEVLLAYRNIEADDEDAPPSLREKHRLGEGLRELSAPLTPSIPTEIKKKTNQKLAK